MIDSIASIAAEIASLVGAFFFFASAVGLLRLPDFYTRMHAPTKAATLGIILLAVGSLRRETDALRGQGERSPSGGAAGDILIAVAVAAHPYFHRRGSNLYVTVPVTGLPRADTKREVAAIHHGGGGPGATAAVCLAIGALVVLIRVANPAYPGGVMLAILFMNGIIRLLEDPEILMLW